MMLTRFLVTFVTMCLLAIATIGQESAPNCDGSSNVKYLKIPKAMSLESFDTNYDGKVQYQAFYARAYNSDSYMPLYDSDIRIKKRWSGAYTIELAGLLALGNSSVPDPSACIKDKLQLYPLYGTNSAMFIWPNGVMLSFVSSCPTKYLWYMSCYGWKPGQRRCAVDNTLLGVIFPSLERKFIMPWKALDDEIEETTLSFGGEELDWYNVYGTPTNCSVAD